MWNPDKSICQVFTDVCTLSVSTKCMFALKLAMGCGNCKYILCHTALVMVYIQTNMCVHTVHGLYIQIYFIHVCVRMHTRVCIFCMSEWWQGSKYRGECWEILITQKQCREI